HARIHGVPKNNFTSGIRGPAFSMAVLRIRRRLPAGLNGQGRQMFVVVNKFCGLDGRRSFGAVQLAAVLIRIRAFHTTGLHWLIEGPDEQSSPPRRCRGGLYHALSIRNRFGAMIARNILSYSIRPIASLGGTFPSFRRRQPNIAGRHHDSIRRQLKEGATEPVFVASEALKDVDERSGPGTAWC